MPRRGGDKGSHSVNISDDLPPPVTHTHEEEMQKAPRSTRGLARRSHDDGTLALSDAAQQILEIVVDAAGAFYSVQPADSLAFPDFAMQQLVNDAGAVITRRRIYDVLHVWEALGLVTRKSRRVWTWYGEAGYRAFRIRVLTVARHRVSCADFVSTELSNKVSCPFSCPTLALLALLTRRKTNKQTPKGSSNTQQLALAIYYLFEHPGRIRLRDGWSREEFSTVAQEAHVLVTIPDWSRRRYDVLNIFIAMGLVHPRDGAPRRSHGCRMDWTPAALTCRPRAIAEEPTLRHVVDAIRGLEALPVVRVQEPVEQQQPVPNAPAVVVVAAPIIPAPAPSPLVVFVNDRDIAPSTPKSPIGRSHLKRSEPDAVPVRPLRKRTPTFKRSAEISLDQMLPSPPPPLPPVSDMLSNRQQARSSVFTSSSDSNASSAAGSLDSPEYASARFVCDTKVWDEFSSWANEDSALPPLFDGDVLRLEPLKTFTGSQ